LCFDYGATTDVLAERGLQGWLRTYSGHGRGDSPFTNPGLSDITADVAIDQLPGQPSLTTQADWLRGHGLDEVVAEGKRIWAERAHIGDLAALAGLSRAGEAEALTDPSGMGAFVAMEWQV
jgi:SAM-dependent MidA family methyltransferase